MNILTHWTLVRRIIMIALALTVIFCMTVLVLRPVSIFGGTTPGDFQDLAYRDSLKFFQEEMLLREELEKKLGRELLATMQGIFSEDRVRDLNIRVELDLSRKTIETAEFFPFEAGNLEQDSIVRSFRETSTSWEGTGFNPEYSHDVTYDTFRDLGHLHGIVTQVTRAENLEINQRNIVEEGIPGIVRITVSVNIDGIWRIALDEKGSPIIDEYGIKRVYTPISSGDLEQLEILLQNAAGYNAARGDSVSVHNIPFDRSQQFAREDAEYFSALALHGR